MQTGIRLDVIPTLDPATPARRPLLVRACLGEPTERVPVWIMRQAGRYLPEYQAVRARAGFVEVCTTPELAVEVTLQPVRRLGVDAAIIFSDILLPLRAMGSEFTYDDKPKLARPIRTREQVEALRRPEAVADFAFLHESIRRTRAALCPETALIGFAGAPFTLANYLVEGGSSADPVETKKFLAREPEVFHGLMAKLADMTADFLGVQAMGGAQVLMIFESSGGILSPRDYIEFALPYAKRVIAAARALGTPVIFFPRGCGGHLETFADCGADVVGIDWQTPIGTARARLGGAVAIQGNLDPAALLGPIPAIERKVAEILAELDDHRGFIFNLGHGILPATPPENAEALVRAVKGLTSKGVAP